jgi:hypothetical protein
MREQKKLQINCEVTCLLPKHSTMESQNGTAVKINSLVTIEFLPALTVENNAFWDVMPCSLVQLYRTVLWLKWLVAGLLVSYARLVPRPHGIYGKRSGTGRYFCPGTWDLLSHYYSTNAPYSLFLLLSALYIFK